MNVVGYARFSSENQRDGYSIEAQTRAIQEWAAREGHIVLKFYVDKAQSATTDDREEFQQMINDASHGEFQAVIVHKLDRFARDRYASAMYKHKLKSYGVRVISVLEPLDDSPESIMMEAVLEGMAEYYSRNLAREVRKGLNEAALLGRHVTGPVPYGFTTDKDNRYVIVPEQAAVIREIFQKLDSGMSVADVARWGVSIGIKMPSGRLIDEQKIRLMINSPLLVGKFTFGKKGGNPIIIDNVVEPIVDPEIFWRQYNKMKMNARGPRKRKKEEEYILTGYLFCEYCGNHIYGFKSSRSYKNKAGELKNYSKRSYRCSLKGGSDYHNRLMPDYKPATCELKNIEKDLLESFVFGAITYTLFESDTIDWVVVEMEVRTKRQKPDESVRLEAFKKERDKLNKQRDRLLDLYLAEGISKEDYSNKANEIKMRETFINNEIKRLAPNLPKKLSADNIKSLLTKFVNSANADSPEYKNRLLDTFVDRITVSNNHIVITFKFPIPGAGEKVEFNLHSSDDKSTHNFVRKETNSFIY